MRKLFKERKLFKGGNYMRKYGTSIFLCYKAIGTGGHGAGDRPPDIDR